MPSSTVALYWMGTSMRAARANADSFCCAVVLLAMIEVKLTNCMKRGSHRQKTMLVIHKLAKSCIVKEVCDHIIRLLMTNGSWSILHLEVVEVARRELVVELLHVLPGAIPDTDQHD